MFRKILVVLAFGLFAVPVLAMDGSTPQDINNQIFGEAKANVKTISAATLKSWVEEGKEFLLLDIREPDEVTAARIETKNHLEIPRGVVEFLFPKKGVKADTTIVVYCLVGLRGAVVTDLLTKYGYTHVYNLEGGIMSWITAGYPVTNFIGSFEMKNLDSVWLNVLPKK